MSVALGSVLVGILFLSATVQSNSYYGGDNSQPAAAQPPAVVPSQNTPTTGTIQQGDLWWLKNNPFQKPANHPGLERGDTKPCAGGQTPCNTGSYTQQTSGSYSNRPIQTQTQVGGGWSSPNQEVKPQENTDCLLRNKGDCHTAPVVPVVTAPINYQQTGYPDGGNVVVPETAYRPPKFNDPYKPQPHGPTPPPLPYQSNPIPISPQLTIGVNPKPIESNYQQTQVSSGQYEPKPFVNYNTQYTNNQNNVPSEIQAPYPGCPAAMLCVLETWCNAEGVSAEKPISLSPAEKLYRVALMACSFPTTGEVGVCCRDPNYKDPWPDMGTGGGGQHHHTKDSSGGHGHNDGQYKPHQHNSGQYDNGQYNPVQHQTSGGFVVTNQQTHTTHDIPASPVKQGGGYTTVTGDNCRPSY